MVADLGVDKVLLAPFEVDELLLGRQIEVKQSLYELGPLKSFEACSRDQVALDKLKNDRPLPATPVLDANNPRLLNFHLILCLINIVKILAFQVNLVVGYDLIVRQTEPHIDEKLIAVHKQWAKVTRAQRLASAQYLILS